MDISEYIYEGEVEPSYKRSTREGANCAVHRRLKRGESTLSNTYSEIIDNSGKRRKIYLDYTKGNSKPTCLIHVPGRLSDECKVLGYFGSKYDKIRPNKDRGCDPKNRDKFSRQK